MKKLLPALLILLLTLHSYAQIASSDYVTTWKTDNPGTSTTTQITIPATGEYTVYYESIPVATSGTLPASGTYTNAQTIQLPSAGTYRIAIKPTGVTPFHRINFNNTSDRRKLLSVDQWGSTVWSSLQNAYWGCSNLTAISATDVPILSSVITMVNAFRDCSSLVVAPMMNNWNMSNVTDMSAMFTFATSFNQFIGDWDVSKVTNMQSMFVGASLFNQPLTNWNVGNVTNMFSMFNGAISFNQPLTTWNVSNVINMFNMFSTATSFNQPIDNWDVSNVTNMSAMFQGASAFNQPLNNWNVGNVTAMSVMFQNAGAFNQPLTNWNVGNVTAMGFMFSGATSFNQPLNNWNVSKVIMMGGMFNDATSFNQPLNNWNVSKVQAMDNMFHGASAFNQPLNNWTLNLAVDLLYMFIASGIECGNYSNTLIGWASNPATPLERILYVGDRTYGPGASTARDYLRTTKKWAIVGDKLDAGCTFVSLPVQLVNFTVNAVELGNLLQWSTSAEQNNKEFDIERSNDAIHWIKIGSVNAQSDNGNSSDLLYYSFTDTNSLKGINYYRFLQRDYSGQWQYSPIRSISSNSESKVTLSPNPTQNKVKLTNLNKGCIIVVYNLTGQLLQRHQVAHETEEISLEAYPEGMYNVAVISDYASAKILRVLKK